MLRHCVRAEAEAEKARKCARILNEHLQHRWLSRRSPALNDDAVKSAGAMLAAVEAVLTETREKVEALTVCSSPTGSCCKPPCQYDG